MKDLQNAQFALTNSLVTLNKAQGGLSVGGTNGVGEGGGIDQDSTDPVVDLSFTTVTANLASTSDPEIRVFP